MNTLGFTQPRVTPSAATNRLNGDEMNTEPQSQSQDRDRGATAGSISRLALFVVAELLCTGVLVASLILWD